MGDPVCSSANTLFEDDGAGGGYACNDGIDNDGDGFVDGTDLGCDEGFDDDEQDPLTECNDGIDNDNDGWTDLADPICSTIAIELEDDGFEPNGYQCNDGIDNDLDGQVDSDDIQCISAIDNSEAH